MKPTNTRPQGATPAETRRSDATVEDADQPQADAASGNFDPGHGHSGGKRSSSGSNYGDWRPTAGQADQGQPLPPGSHDAGSTISGAAATPAGSGSRDTDQHDGKPAL